MFSPLSFRKKEWKRNPALRDYSYRPPAAVMRALGWLQKKDELVSRSQKKHKRTM
jgi:hypothetical protein